MTTFHHTPIVAGESNSPDTINTRLGTLDAAINDTGSEIANLIAQSGTSDTEVVNARDAGKTNSAVTTLALRLAYAAANAYHPMAYGATGDGSANDYTAFNAIKTAVSAADSYMVIDRHYMIDTSLTLPENLSLIFVRGGKVSVGTGDTLTIEGVVEAGLSQIFAGSGVVSFTDGVQKVFRPEWWGASNDSTVDSSAAMQKAFNQTPEGATLLFNTVYAVTEIEVLRSTNCRKMTLLGNGSATAKFSSACGLVAYANCAYILQLGADDEAELDGVTIQGLTIGGGSKIISTAMLSCGLFSQAKIVDCLFINAYGRAISGKKIEDTTIDRCNFWRVGSNAAPGAIYFDEKIAAQEFGNNVIRITNCRFENFTGGALRTAPAGRVGLLNVYNCKFEVSEGGLEYDTGEANDGASGSGLNQAVINLAVPSLNTAASVGGVDISNCHFMNTGGNDFHDKLIHLTCGDGFMFMQNRIVMGNYAIQLFELEAATSETFRNFIFKDNQLRNTTYLTSSWTATLDNDSGYPIVFEWPQYMPVRTWESNRNPISQIISVHEIALTAFVPDPASDSLDPRQTVISRTGATEGLMTRLYAGGHGLTPKTGSTVKVFARMKKSDSNTAQVKLKDGTGTTLSSVSVTSTSWAWYVLIGSQDLSTLTTGLTIYNSSATNAGTTIYIDAVRVEPVVS